MTRFVIIILLVLTSSGCIASSLQLAGENCLEKQFEIGNEYIFTASEETAEVGLEVTTFISSPIYMIRITRLDKTTSNAGPFSVCHAIRDDIAVAFFEYGEFGAYAIGKQVYIETEPLDLNLETKDNYIQECVASFKNDRVKLSFKSKK
jgi:Mg2+ and Co2+ transporter CorA